MYLLVFGFRDIKTKICCSLKGWSLTFMLNLPNLNPFSMRRINLGIAAILGLLTVIIGAFGAHMLKEKLEPESLQSFETGVRYMMYHALAVLLINSTPYLTEKSKNLISMLFFAGILLFSGSIFVISTGLISAKYLWFITPLGGFLFISGWLATAISFFRSDK